MDAANHNENTAFFVTGGTMTPDALSYVEREADRDLYESLLDGKYCYVLTARQMGKSSLTARTAVKLRDAGAGAAVVDLSSIGRNLTIDQWYGSVLSWIGSGINLSEGELEKFWQSLPLLSPVQRWLRALREIILPRYLREYSGQLVVFMDEVDYVLDLPFPMDEFFAAIRECYNLRAEDAAIRRLTFCLVGVATPSDLIRNKRTTPFNIGRRIELHDFTPTEALPLARGLRREDQLGRSLLNRVLHWTGGHPFLTQRLCQAVAENADANNDSGVDGLCDGLFLTRRAQEREDNLLLVRDSLLRDEADRAALLDLYAKVRKGKRVVDDNTNPLVNILRLSGITRAEDDCLKIRNRIYECVFNEEWIRENMPGAELRRQRAAYRRGLLRAGLIGGVILFLLGALAVNEVRRQTIARETAQRLLTAAQPQMSQEEIETVSASTADVGNLIRTITYVNQIRQVKEALAEANVSRAEELLNKLRPGNGEPDLRDLEWYQLWQTSHQESKSLRLNNPVAALRFARQGRQIAVAEIVRTKESSGYEFKIFDWAEVKEEGSSGVQSKGAFDTVIFTPDLQKVLVGGKDNTVSLLDAQSGKILRQFTGHDQLICSTAMSQEDERVVTADTTGRLRFWQGAIEIGLSRPKRHPGGVVWVGLSRNGARVVTVANTDEMKIWDFATGRETATLKIPGSRLVAAIFSPDERSVFAARSDGAIWIIKFREKKIVLELKGHSGQIRAMASSPDGKMLATAGDDRTARIWDAATGQALAEIKGHGSEVAALAWSPDSKYLATGGMDKDSKVKFWDVARMIAGGTTVDRKDLATYFATAFSEEGDLIALVKASDGRAKILRVSSGEVLAALDESANDPNFAVFSPNARSVVTAGDRHAVTIWDLRSGKRIWSSQDYSQLGKVYAAAFSLDERRLAFITGERTLKILDTTTWQEITPPRIETRLSYPIAFSPNGEQLAVADQNGEVILWNLSSKRAVVFKGHSNVVRTIVFSRDGSKLATGGMDNSLKVWDARMGTIMKEMGQLGLLYRAAFSPDGRRLVTGSNDGTIKIWDLTTWQELMTLHKHTNEVTSITYSRDGMSLSTSGKDGVKLWRKIEP